MFLARRSSASLSGASNQAPVLSPLGVPERRSRQSQALARRRARLLFLTHVLVYSLCLGLGVLAGLLTARALGME